MSLLTYLTHSCLLHSSSPRPVPSLWLLGCDSQLSCAVSKCFTRNWMLCRKHFLSHYHSACMSVGCVCSWQEPSINQKSAWGHLHISWLSSMGQTCPASLLPGGLGYLHGWVFAPAGAEPVVYLTRLTPAAAPAPTQSKDVLFGRRLPGAGCPVCCDKQGNISCKHLPKSQVNRY